MAKYHVTVHGADRAAMADLVRVHGVRVYPQTLNVQDDDSRVDAVADEATIERLTDAGYRVDRHEDVDEDAQGQPATCRHGQPVRPADGQA